MGPAGLSPHPISLLFPLSFAFGRDKGQSLGKSDVEIQGMEVNPPLLSNLCYLNISIFTE